MTLSRITAFVFCNVISAAILSHAAFSDDPSLPRCPQGPARDSYGRGTSSAFSGHADLRPRHLDEGCYRLGLIQGDSLRAQQEPRCDKSFSRGREEGVRFQRRSEDTSCQKLGHEAGLADLNIAAREGDALVAGEACVRAYRLGREDFHQNLASTPSKVEGYKARYCYGNGWFEAPIVR